MYSCVKKKVSLVQNLRCVAKCLLIRGPYMVLFFLFYDVCIAGGGYIESVNKTPTVSDGVTKMYVSGLGLIRLLKSPCNC